MEGKADTPMSPDPGGGPPPPHHQPSRQAPLLAAHMRKARSLPPGVPEDPQEPPQDPPSDHAARAPGQPPAPKPSGDPGRPADPLSVPFQIPSGGVHYPEYGHQNLIYISPTRGAQEEVLAGVQGGSGARLKVLMHVTKQCLQTGNIPFGRLLLDDWVAAVLHFLSYSAGSDILALRPKHSACGASFPATMKLSDLPLVALRLAGDGEAPNWPPVEEDEELDEELRILREMEMEEARATSPEGSQSGEEIPNLEWRILSRQDAQEPFTAQLVNGDVVTFKLARLDDLVQAEEFSERVGSTRNEPGTKLHSFLLARHIVTINGESYTPTRAYQWVKGQPSPVLSSLRDQINAHTCGYDTAPRFRCKNCGVSFKVRLPLDGSLFRRPTGRR